MERKIIYILYLKIRFNSRLTISRLQYICNFTGDKKWKPNFQNTTEPETIS